MLTSNELKKQANQLVTRNITGWYDMVLYTSCDNHLSKNYGFRCSWVNRSSYIQIWMQILPGLNAQLHRSLLHPKQNTWISQLIYWSDYRHCSPLSGWVHSSDYMKNRLCLFTPTPAIAVCTTRTEIETSQNLYKWSFLYFS